MPSLFSVRSLLLSTALIATPTFVFAQVGSFQEGFAGLVRDVSPAVVNITVETDSGLARIPPGLMEGPRRSLQGAGSGFFIAEDGIIVTNNHVIEDATSITVETVDGQILDATLLGRDPLTDLAVLDVEGEGFATVGFGDSDATEPGDWAIAVGNPLGQGLSVSLGIVSAQGRSLSGAFDDYIQTDAAINQGNSGGPLFNTDGEVIGINTAILSPTGGSIGIGFSMASNVAKDVVDQLREHGETRRGWLGVQIQPITPDIAAALGLERDEGALIAGLIDGPAQEAGLRAGDVVVAVDDTPITSARDLTRAAAAAGPEARLVLGVLRNNDRLDIPVVLGRREDAERKTTNPPQETPKSATVFGVQVGVLAEPMVESLGLPQGTQGVIVLSTPPGSDRTFNRGDIVVSINNTPITDPGIFVDTLQALEQEGRSFALAQVLREGRPLFLPIPLRPER